jgi:hypothetical protein
MRIHTGISRNSLLIYLVMDHFSENRKSKFIIVSWTNIQWLLASVLLISYRLQIQKGEKTKNWYKIKSKARENNDQNEGGRQKV